MLKKMPYSLYKSSYSHFPSEEYDPKTKTILVDLPTITRKKWPKDWIKVGNHFNTPNGCTVYFWNTGLAQNYDVWNAHGQSQTIPAGIDAFERVMAAVQILGES